MPTARILVTEDESIVAADIQSTLEDLGYAVPVIASSGEEAIRKAEETRPDLVMISMPAYGASGPYRDYVSFGWAQEHMAGLTSRTGYAGGPPQKTGTIVADPLNGVHATVAIGVQSRSQGFAHSSRILLELSSDARIIGRLCCNCSNWWLQI